MKKSCIICCVLLVTSICFGNVSIPDSLVTKYFVSTPLKESFWDKNLGSIIVGIISFSAVIIGGMISYFGGRRNIDNQLKAQILTTINNEHIKITREQISEVLCRTTFLIVGMKEYKLIEHTYIDDIKMCYKAYFILTTLLDESKEIESSLLSNTKTLVVTMSDDMKNNALEDNAKYEALMNNVIQSSHVYFSTLKSKEAINF